MEWVYLAIGVLAIAGSVYCVLTMTKCSGADQEDDEDSWFT